MYCCDTRKSHPQTRTILSETWQSFVFEGEISLSHNNTSWILYPAHLVSFKAIYEFSQFSIKVRFFGFIPIEKIILWCKNKQYLTMSKKNNPLFM